MAGKGITIVIKGDGESAKRALEMVQHNLDKTASDANSAANQIAGAMEKVKFALGAVGVSLGLQQGIDLLKRMVASSVDLGVEIGKTAQETGISAQNLSVLKYASDVTGVSFEALTKGMGRLSKSMLDAEEGKKAAVQRFERLGISQADVTAHSNDMLGMLTLVANRFQTIPDGPLKAGAAIELFGKAGMNLIPFLDQGGAGIQKLAAEASALGIVLDEQGVASLEAMHHALVQMQGGLEGASIGITSGLEPAIAGLVGVLTGATAGTSAFVAVGKTLGEWALGAAYSMNYLIKVVRETAAEYQSLAAHINGAFDSIDAKIGFTEGQRASAAKHLIQDINESNAAILAGKRAGADYEKTANALAAIDLNATTPSASASGGAGGSIKRQDQSGAKSGDSIARAATALAEAQSQAQASAQREANNRLIAILDAAHKAQLVSDADFYQEKLLLEKDSLDAEVDAELAKQKQLQALYAQQRGDKLLKRDKGGNSAEELKTQQELVSIAQKVNDLAEKRATLDSVAPIEAQLRADQVRLATAKLAAEVEEQTNRTITARLALLRQESAEELKKIATTAGKDSPEYAEAEALERLKAAKLQIGDVNRQITATEDDYKRAVGELNDAAEKDPRLKRAAQQQINALNAQEAAQLKTLVAEYDALAQTLGGPFLETARNLHAELDKLNRPDNREDAQLGKTLADGVEGMANRIADAAASGKESFHKMAKSIEKDALDLAIKLAEKKWITPLLEGAGAGKLPQVNPGTNPGASAVAGLAGLAAPSLAGLANPIAPQGGGFGGFLKDFLGAGKAGAAGGTPNIRITIDNTSSQPVSMSQAGQSYDSDAREFVVHTVLEDASSGGVLANLFLK